MCCRSKKDSEIIDNVNSQVKNLLSVEIIMTLVQEVQMIKMLVVPSEFLSAFSISSRMLNAEILPKISETDFDGMSSEDENHQRFFNEFGKLDKSSSIDSVEFREKFKTVLGTKLSLL